MVEEVVRWRRGVIVSGPTIADAVLNIITERTAPVKRLLGVTRGVPGMNSAFSDADSESEPAEVDDGRVG